MNRLHRWYCGSDRWGREVRRHLVPWALADVAAGGDVLEIGPGPGVTTEVLRERADTLTAVEFDKGLAERLRARLGDGNVEVIHGDASDLPFIDGTARHGFDVAASFTMLHHIPSPVLQDQVLRELCRVLRPGGVLIGTDSLPSPLFRLAHLGDTMTLVDPAGLSTRLTHAGFVDPRVERTKGCFRFSARRPY